MLHDPGHINMYPASEQIILNHEDKSILRNLAGKVAEIALQPIQHEKGEMWRRMNDLKQVRPMVWINEICWNEMNYNDELTIKCKHPWAQQQETQLRRELYQWTHLPADMVVSDFMACNLAIHSTDFGIVEDVDSIKTDASNNVVSRHFNRQIVQPEDIEKIRMPVVSHNKRATEIQYQTMLDIYRDIMPVKKQGQTHIWFTPWDYLIRWWGIEEAMVDLVSRPEMVHAAVSRMVDAWMVELDQFIEQNLLSLDNNNTRVGSGGYGFVSELPGAGYDPEQIKPCNMWGCSNAQIFSCVSPDMHWDFALSHDIRWLERFGLTYYGCCEQLHDKLHLLRRIKNLRKFSVSAWADTGKIAEFAGNEYVLSIKPSPAVFAEDVWNPVAAKADLVQKLEKARGCNVEIIMKDISTVRYQPQRLWEWSQIAMELVEKYRN
jgi:hypothetical protein